MDIYLTKEKLSYDGSHDLYIGKINRKRLYCLNDVCRIFGIFFRETKKSLVENGMFTACVMIQRKKRYMENTFVDYDGLIEVLLMSRYDKSVAFKKWLDSIPATSFKKCQKYVKKSETKESRPKAKKARFNANKITENKSVEVTTSPVTVEVKPSNNRKSRHEIVERQKVESNKSRYLEDIKAYSVVRNNNDIIEENDCTVEDNKLDTKCDLILSICDKAHFSVDMLIFYLGHLDFSARVAYMNNPLIDYPKAAKNLFWVEYLRRELKRKYIHTPYYKNTPTLVRQQEELKKLKEKR